MGELSCARHVLEGSQATLDASEPNRRVLKCMRGACAPRVSVLFNCPLQLRFHMGPLSQRSAQDSDGSIVIAEPDLSCWVKICTAASSASWPRGTMPALFHICPSVELDSAVVQQSGPQDSVDFARTFRLVDNIRLGGGDEWCAQLGGGSPVPRTP